MRKNTFHFSPAKIPQNPPACTRQFSCTKRRTRSRTVECDNRVVTVDHPDGLRADARRNRDQIIAAAKEMFAESGFDVPMEELARRAGVGVGTLYRRFPDREALIRAVAQTNYAQVLASAETAAVEEKTAWNALVLLLSRSRELRLSVQLAIGHPHIWAMIKKDPEVRRFQHALMDVLDRLVHAAQEDGQLRKDVGTGDVAVLVSLLLRRMPVPAEHSADALTDRVLALLLDGLRPRPGSSLPGEIVTVEQLHAP